MHLNTAFDYCSHWRLLVFGNIASIEVSSRCEGAMGFETEDDPSLEFLLNYFLGPGSGTSEN